MARLLFRKRRSLSISAEDTFVTSDKPVALQHPDKSVPGLATQAVVVTFPVSPTRLLVMDDNHAEPLNQHYRLKLRAGALANLPIWRGGSRFMITGRPIEAVLQEVLDTAVEH